MKKKIESVILVCLAKNLRLLMISAEIVLAKILWF